MVKPDRTKHDMTKLDMMKLEEIHKTIRSCPLCDLALSRTLAVPGEGPCPAEIMLVGEAPGAEEDLTGRPFGGRAGKLLTKALAEAGIDRSDVFITSVVKCRPPKNRKPKRWEIDACHPYLVAQMERVRPRVVCLMGNVASSAVLGKQGMASMHGQFFQDRFLVTYHPAAVLRNMTLMDALVSDFKKAKRK
ncbi:MAG TPA: uracil-DNA glycosylase [Methanotrichaceae archaeon]|nr:uracil-DNA glycosylase [Methanotrichaceae archaeon]